MDMHSDDPWNGGAWVAMPDDDWRQVLHDLELAQQTPDPDTRAHMLKEALHTLHSCVFPVRGMPDIEDNIVSVSAVDDDDEPQA